MLCGASASHARAMFVACIWYKVVEVVALASVVNESRPFTCLGISNVSAQAQFGLSRRADSSCVCERERRRLGVIIIIIQNVCPARLLLPARRSGLEFAFGPSRALG